MVRGGDGDGCEEDGGGVIAHRLGEQRGEQVKRGENRERAERSDNAERVARDEVRGAAFLHGDAERQDAGEEKDHLPINGLVSLLKIDAAGADQRDAAEQRGDEDRQDAECGEADGERDDRHDERRLSPAERGLIDLGEHDEAFVAAQPLDLDLRGLEQQGVAELQAHLAELVPQGLAPALDGERERIVAAAEAQVGERVADEVRARGDERLDEGDILCAERFVLELELRIDDELRGGPQLHEFVELAADEQHVAGAQRLVQRAPQLVLFPQDLEHRGRLRFPQHAGRHGFPDERRVLRHAQLDDVIAELIRLGELRAAPVGQHPSAAKKQVERAGDKHDQPERRELEHGKRAAPALLGDGADEQICGGADERADAAELRGVGERDEQPGGRDLAPPAQGQHQRQEDGDSGGVIDESGHCADGQHHQQEERGRVLPKAHERAARR